MVDQLTVDVSASAGEYRIWATWPADQTNTPGALYEAVTIVDGETTVLKTWTDIDQRVAPGGAMFDGVPWQELDGMVVVPTGLHPRRWIRATSHSQR